MFENYYGILFFAVLIIGIVFGLYLKNKKEKEENKIISLYKYIYQIKEISNILGCLKKYKSEIVNYLVTIEPEELDVIEEHYLQKIHALTIKLNMKYEKTFDFIGNRLFINIALQKDDTTFIKTFINNFYENTKPPSYISEMIEYEIINAINKCSKVGETI